MAGSTLGSLFKISTWGESHGKGVGVTIDGCPAGLELTEEDIQIYLNRRKPGQSTFTTARQEGDLVEILSGVFEGKTTGTPIALLVRNTDQRSHDYSTIMDIYRPGHADYCFDAKYGFRDYRGGGRSSGRETIARVAAGAIACKILSLYGIKIMAYTRSIGPYELAPERFDADERLRNRLCFPDAQAAAQAEAYVKEMMTAQDSVGGVIECRITGVPAGIGEPVFDKLDARLALAVMSIGAVKGFEIGDGFAAARACGSEHNDAFCQAADGSITKETNHSGGILGGMSDGGEIIFRAAFKPTPSIAAKQNTVDREGNPVEIHIHGRHDPIVVPRAVVVVEAMAALTVLDLYLMNQVAKL